MNGNKLHFLPMTEGYAREAIAWRYPDDYAIYDLADEGADILTELLAGDYYAAVDEAGALCAFVAFGGVARIPTVEEGVYQREAMDIGLGRRADLCGRGNGGMFFAQVLAFARGLFPGKAMRLTVASWNQRAIKVYRQNGFVRSQQVTHRNGGMAFDVMLLEA